MTAQSLNDRLVFGREAEASTLPPECALIVISSTLATPPAFLIQHFLQQLFQSHQNEAIVFLSFLNPEQPLFSNMKKMVSFSFVSTVVLMKGGRSCSSATRRSFYLFGRIFTVIFNSINTKNSFSWEPDNKFDISVSMDDPISPNF